MLKTKIADTHDWTTIKKLRRSALSKAFSLYCAPEEAQFTKDSQWQKHVKKSTDNGNIIAIAYDGDEAVGMGAGKPNPYKDDAYIMHSLWVEPHARGKGVAQSLIAERSRYAHAQGYKHIQACSSLKNTASRTLYKDLGYREILSPSEFRPIQAEHEVLYIAPLDNKNRSLRKPRSTNSI